MKIEQSKVRVDMPREKSAAGGFLKVEPAQVPGRNKPNYIDNLPHLNIDDMNLKPRKSKPIASSMPASPLRDDYGSLRETALSVERIKAAAMHELEQIRKMRADTIRYQQETATRARSEANQLILRARLATQREIEDLIHQAGEEIQKMLADIRVIRITAQEELSAQRKFTDAAKLNSLSFSFKEEMEKTMAEKTVSKPKRQPLVTG